MRHKEVVSKLTKSQFLVLHNIYSDVHNACEDARNGEINDADRNEERWQSFKQFCEVFNVDSEVLWSTLRRKPFRELYKLTRE